MNTRRKRNLEQFVKVDLEDPSCFAVPNQPNREKLHQGKLSSASSTSCLLNSIHSIESHDEVIVLESDSSCSSLSFGDTLTERKESANYSFSAISLPNNPIKKTSSVVDSDESVYDSDPPSHVETMAVPVGPYFQAEVPEWNGRTNKKNLISAYKSDSDNFKWLGTRVWPIENSKIAARTIGKGRPNSCSCVVPGSVDCIERHIVEKSAVLKCELGPTFFRWKFDEMGQHVSKSWTLKEKQTFESLVKRKSSYGNYFMDNTLKCLSGKYRKDIVTYYFNVYIPQRMSMQRRSSPVKRVDTDDEVEAEPEPEDVNDKGSSRRCGGETLVANSKGVKARYLRRA